MKAKWFILGLGMITFLALPPIVSILESNMVGHMLVQIPGLILGGIFLGYAIKGKWIKSESGFNEGGIPSILLAVILLSFWALPRSLDMALTNSLMEIAKFISLPLFVGIPTVYSWPKLHGIVKGFLWANLTSMLGIMSWLYMNSPVRLCNNYLLNEQQILGKAMLILTVLNFMIGVYIAFMGRSVYDEYRSER
jgi:hypothetical protein